MDVDVVRLLASDAGRDAIASSVAALAAGDDELSVLSRLRRTFDAPVAAAILAQARLRPRAVAKLGDRAGGLLVLPDSLEQASRPEVSGVRARRLLDAGITRVVDAGAGLGADSIGYAEAGLSVTAIERDPLVAEVLRHNVNGLDVEVIEGDALDLLHSGAVVRTAGVYRPAVGASDCSADGVSPDSGVSSCGAGAGDRNAGGIGQNPSANHRSAGGIGQDPDVSGCGAGVAVYFDPSRRSDGRRVFDPEECAPPLSALVRLAENGLTVVAKMSPSLGLDDVPAGWDADWVSTQTEHGRSVVEATLWSPPLGTGSRRAVVLHRSAPGAAWSTATLPAQARRETTPATGASSESDARSSARPIARYIYEPDGAVNQAEVVGELATLLHADSIAPRIAYLTGNHAIDTPFARRYEVLEQLPWSKRALARRLASVDASDLVIKKRGVTVDPTALRRELLPRLRSRTGEPLVVILTPHAGRVLALLARAAGVDD